MALFSQFFEIGKRAARRVFSLFTSPSHLQAPRQPIRVPIGRLADFPDGCGVALVVAGRRLAIFRCGERLFAIDNVCSHNRFPLADGSVQGIVVTCRTHGARFNLETGAVVRGPARKAVCTYPIYITGEQVEVEVPSAPLR